MTKLTTIDRHALGVLGNAFAAELKELGEKYGVRVSPYGGQYGGPTGQVRLKVEVMDTGAGLSGQQQKWNTYCAWYQFEPADFHRTFVFKGHVYKMVAINPNAPRYPIEAVRIHDNQGMRFSASTVKAGLQPRVKAAA